jgi:hypothetical protein
MRRKFGFGMLAALLVVVGGISGSAVATFADPSPTRTLTVVIQEREARVVDLGPAGPSQGDLRVINAPLYNEHATKAIGRTDHVCTVTEPADDPGEQAQGHIMQCLTTYSLPGGQLTAQGVFTYPALTEPVPEGRRAITGGTGEYHTARGEVQTRTQGEQTIVTLQLILAPVAPRLLVGTLPASEQAGGEPC